MKFKIICLLSCSLLCQAEAQVEHARNIVDTLTSTYFWGRGYTEDGLDKASKYLASQFGSIGLKPIKGESFYQEFTYSVNTFPGKVEVEINGRQLTAGRDFIVGAESRGIKASGTLVKQDSTHFVDQSNRIIISLEGKLTWSVSQQAADYTSVIVDKSVLTQTPESVKVNLTNKIIPKFKTSNVAGMITGTTNPNKFVAITAHYDHLGGMGRDTYFPGANDNASGIAMLLTLAKYYAENPPPYSVLFICFSGEEAGLMGSKYYTENPLVPLENIRFLTNLDLVGTGDDGITVVNASIHPTEFSKLKHINDAGQLFVNVKSRGKAANSDHYFFTEKGVPAFFIYTLGGIKAYHDIFDISSTLPYTEFNDLFELIIKFNAALMEEN
jgi:hypothetical protein